jgi:hypothetical protein
MADPGIDMPKEKSNIRGNSELAVPTPCGATLRFVRRSLRGFREIENLFTLSKQSLGHLLPLQLL